MPDHDFVAGCGPEAAAICEILGFDSSRVTSLKLEIDVQGYVKVTTTCLVRRDEVVDLAEVIESFGLKAVSPNA